MKELLEWDAALRADSRAALIYEVWTSKLRRPRALQTDAASLEIARARSRNRAALRQGSRGLAMGQAPPADPGRIRSGKHEFQLGPVARPGDANTVNATSGTNFRQTNGASWREVLDVGDWDRSVMTNVPGESGDPASKHYGDLLADWAAGRVPPDAVFEEGGRSCDRGKDYTATVGVCMQATVPTVSTTVASGKLRGFRSPFHATLRWIRTAASSCCS